MIQNILIEILFVVLFQCCEALTLNARKAKTRREKKTGKISNSNIEYISQNTIQKSHFVLLLNASIEAAQKQVQHRAKVADSWVGPERQLYKTTLHLLTHLHTLQ